MLQVQHRHHSHRTACNYKNCLIEDTAINSELYVLSPWNRQLFGEGPTHLKMVSKSSSTLAVLFLRALSGAHPLQPAH